MAVKKTSRLQTKTNMLLACLAVTDASTGLLTQPLFIVWKAFYLLEVPDEDAVGTFYFSVSRGLTICSALHLMLVTCERLIAIRFTYHHPHLVTGRNIKVAVIVFWLISISNIIGGRQDFIFEAIRSLLNFSAVLIVVFCVLFIVFAYAILYREVRRQRKNIKNQQLPQEEQQRIAKENKALKTTVLVVGAVLVCYVPVILTVLVFYLFGLDSGSCVYCPWVLASSGVLIGHFRVASTDLLQSEAKCETIVKMIFTLATSLRAIIIHSKYFAVSDWLQSSDLFVITNYSFYYIWKMQAIYHDRFYGTIDWKRGCLGNSELKNCRVKKDSITYEDVNSCGRKTLTVNGNKKRKRKRQKKWKTMTLQHAAGLFSIGHKDFNIFATLRSVLNFLAVLIVVSCVFFVVFAYVILYREVHRQRKNIKNQQLPQEEQQRIAKENKALKTTVLVVGAVLLCYVPVILTVLVFYLFGLDNGSCVYCPWVNTFIMFNSFVNPLIYCWRQKEMRQYVLRFSCTSVVEPQPSP
ncbi:unnamed protein product [Porites lobata]|uniref:G-protein coupled receptors family 1 profile domain-containing protein n=1 Tax=Porites lobata TaxID=104759 RepID=A0ABN8NLZ2_9CNID|nr:unnamed protein product [Porites lobata]